MSVVHELVARHHERLSGFPAPLEQLFDTALRALNTRLSPSQLQIWAENGIELTSLSLRSWEAAAEYFRAAPAFPANMPWDAYEHLGRESVAMATDSAPLAASFLRSAPLALSAVGPAHLRQWADLGRRLYKGNWKSSSLAAQFYDLSPRIFGVLRISQASRLVLFIDELARHSYELASACLASAPDVLSRMDDDDRVPFLTFAVELAQSSWADSRLYFDRGGVLLQKVHAPVRERYLLLAAQVARRHNRSAFQYFEDAATALGELDPNDHLQVVQLGEVLVPHSPFAAMDFVTNTPRVLGRIRIDELEPWHAAGLRILQASHDGGEAYFRLQSTRGEGILETLSARVELSRVGDILRLYCKALTGRNLAIQTTAALAEKGIGWTDQDRATTEGTTIYLPEVMERFHEKQENFLAIKVFATHQAGRLEFGSFELRYNRPGVLLGDSRSAIPHEGKPATDMERFFDLFPDRRLAGDLFTLTEDARVDSTIGREYGGIRKPLQRMQRAELEHRPDVKQLPLRQAFVENLVRASLDGGDSVLWPKNRAEVMAEGLGILQLVMQKGAIVEDSAEATMRLFKLALGVPNTIDDSEDSEWESVEAMDAAQGAQVDGGQQGGQAGGDPSVGDVGEGDDPYASPQEVDFRGDFKPELVQLLMKLREDAQGGDAGKMSPQALTPEQLQELLEKSVEIDLDSLMEGDMDATTGMFMNNLMKEAGQPKADDNSKGDKTGDDSTGSGEGEEPLIPIITTFYYDEWDFRAQDYKPRWCAVKEQKLEQGEDDFYEKTLREHAGLVAQTRKQFELMKPEMFRKLKRLRDGEDFDLDAAIEWMAEKRAGVNPNDKIYWRRNKIERDVAVAFLIDMSASTDEEINKREKKYDEDDYDDDPRKYLSWWVSKRRQELSAPPKRIIDLEKESTVLLMTALETIGDQYGIYGFSGYGRDNVEFFVIKDFDEQLDNAIKRRLDKITPIRSTRMGPAIRHATYKLKMTDAKVKILVLLSDGRPQDHGYGRDRTEKEYAIHDTKQALNEAKREGITPFALTVDRAGHDYLKTMCEDMGYEVVADIEALPSRLPTLYRRLTE